MKYCQECCQTFENEVSSKIIKQIYKKNRYNQLKIKLEKLKSSIGKNEHHHESIRSESSNLNRRSYSHISNNNSLKRGSNISESNSSFSEKQDDIDCINSQTLIGNLHFDDNIEVVCLQVKKLNPLARKIKKSENFEIILKPIDSTLERAINQTTYIYNLYTGICFENNKQIAFSVSIDEESRLRKYIVLTSTCFADDKEIVIRISSETEIGTESLKKILLYLSLKKNVNFKLTDNQ